jgi:ABC-2 type transport system ATP-binding protein
MLASGSQYKTLVQIISNKLSRFLTQYPRAAFFSMNFSYRFFPVTYRRKESAYLIPVQFPPQIEYLSVAGKSVLPKRTDQPNFNSMDNKTKDFVLQVKGLNVNYGSFQAVRNVSLEVKAGEIFGLLGPNGAGKTSTLSAIEGLLKPASGIISVAGFDMVKEPLLARANTGVQLQATSFQPELTVAEIIRLFAGIYGVDMPGEKLDGILANIKLEDAASKRFGQLSGGQQQRVSLVIAMIHNPKLVLLDEPTTGLDPQSRRQLWERMESMRDNNHGILLTTHSMEEAEAVCDRIAIIDHGQVMTIDSPQGLIESNCNKPEVISASRKGKITLEDVFIGLTGRTIRS